MSWDATGIVFGEGRDGVRRVSPQGGKPEQLVTVKDEEWAHGPQILPDGQTILLTIGKGSVDDKWNAARVVLHSLKTGQQTTLIEGGSDARYLSTGHLVYAVGGVVFAAAFDPARQRIDGEAVPILQGVRRAPIAATATAQFSVSTTGTLMYIPGPANLSTVGQDLALVDRKGGVQPFKLTQAPSTRLPALPRWEAARGRDRRWKDREYLDLQSVPNQRDSAAHIRRQEQISGVVDRQPARGVSVQSRRGSGDFLAGRRRDGNGGTADEAGKRHVPRSNVHVPGRQHAAVPGRPGRRLQAWSFSLKDRRASMLQDVQATNIAISPSFAPDGRWIAVSSNRLTDRAIPGSPDGLGAATVFVMPFPPMGTRTLVARAAHAAWSPDGNELLFRRGGALFVVPIKTQPAFAVGVPVQLPSPGFRDRGGQFQRDYDLLRDGQHIVAVVQPGEDDAERYSSQIEVVLNWSEELKQRVPTR